MADEKKDAVVDEKVDETVEETEESEETTEEAEEGEEQTSEDDLDEPSLVQAKALYKLLKDPNTQDQTIRMMAESRGLLGKNTPDTKAEVKEAKKDILGLLKKSLGPEMEWLALKLSPAITEMLEDERAARDTRISAMEQSQIESATSAAFDKLANETKGLSRKLEPKMVQLANELLPGPNQTPEQYIRRLYTLASADRQATNTRKEMADKINRNSKDAPGRLQTGAVPGVRVPNGSNTKVSLKDAVQNAINNVAKGQR